MSFEDFGTVRQLFATIKGLNSAPAKPWGCIMDWCPLTKKVLMIHP